MLDRCDFFCRRHYFITLIAVILLAACATPPTPPPAGSLVLFSQGQAGRTLPPGWERWSIRPGKKNTQYELVAEVIPDTDGTLKRQPVLRATADNSASGVGIRLQYDVSAKPYLRWQWRTDSLIAKADNTHRYDDDSPVRIVVSFDGDKSKLPGRDRLFMEKARLITGQELPYATLMYIWENKQSVGKIIPSAYTGRIKKIVAQSGPAGLGQWQQLERNLVEDYQRAFGEAPGKLLGIGVMTDTDNTQSYIEAFYGDITLHATPATVPATPR